MLFREILQNFTLVPRPVRYLIGAAFFIQLIEAASFILLNFYLKDLQYTDASIAELVSYKYAAIVLFAFPLGLFIKGRSLVPFFRIGAVLSPSFMLLALLALHWGYWGWAQILFFLFGSSTICIRVTALPFIILNTPKEQHSEAVTLYYQLFSATAFVAGIGHYVLNSLVPSFFTEGVVLIGFAILGYTSRWLVGKVELKENLSEPVPLKEVWHSYEWKRIGVAIFPTLLIAIGAGLTIPFINLFFLAIHGIDARSFSLLGAFSFVMVTLMMIFIPAIRRRLGYNMVVNGFQSLAILALFIMASTEWYADWSGAATIAVVAFLFRQPLMQVASPVTAELTMYYVGDKNQEMMGALNASIWSGSWFFSAIIFGTLRAWDVAYVSIFMMTVGLYLLATLLYYWLIKNYEKQEALKTQATATDDALVSK